MGKNIELEIIEAIDTDFSKEKEGAVVRDVFSP